MKKVYIKTYGCQMNERDAEALAARLAEAGFPAAATEEEADVIILNTCSVRDAAERKAIGKLSYLRKWKNRRPGTLLGVAGCMAQRRGKTLLDEIPHLDFVLGTGELHRAPEIIAGLLAGGARSAETAEPAGLPPGLELHLAPSAGTAAQIAITRGCNRFCSYCIVPYVRGREVSRPRAEIVAEARELAAAGAREILLLGQNVAAYGLNGITTPPPADESPFAELLDELDTIPELLRIRFTSPYPTYFTDRLIGTLARSRSAAHSFHLPLQSGSDAVLKAMNRQYTAAQYLAIVKRIRAAIPDATFSTDVIVGFPGESEEDFAATRHLMEEVGFELAYIFKYSPRPGARSAALEDSVPESVKEERNRILLGDLEKRCRRRLAAMVGETVEVLTEGVSPRNPERWSGRTSTNFVVHFEPPPGIRPGELRKVRITRANVVSVVGEVL